jgi:hypothetical protein
MLLRRAGDVKHRKRVRLGRNLSRRRHLRGHPTKPGPLEARKLGEIRTGRLTVSAARTNVVLLIRRTVRPHTVRASPLHAARKGRGLWQVVSRPLR